MADGVTFNIKGLDELQKKLEEELPKDAKLAMRIALNAGASDVKRAMQDEAPVEAEGEDAGFLRDHVKVKVKMRRNDLAGYALIGPTTEAYPGREGHHGTVSFKTLTGKRVSFIGKAGQVTASNVARWLELGTRYIMPRAWMTKAWERTKEQALNHFIEKLRTALRLG